MSFRPPSPTAPFSVRAAWCFYDWGNSAFATTILAVLFSEYFARVIAGGMEGTLLFGRLVPGATVWTWLLSASLVVVALAAPWTGVRADRARNPVWWLAGLTAPAAVATAFLSITGEGTLLSACVFFAIAMIGFSLATVVYNALLPRLASPAEMGALSGWGWGLGYLGGGIMLAIDLALLNGITIGGREIKLSVAQTFILTAVWWAIFTLPLMRHARWSGWQRKRETRDAGEGADAAAVAAEPVTREQVRDIFRHLLRSPNVLRFLIANLLYNDGVQTVVAMASIFGGTVLGMEPRGLVLYFLVIQGAAFLGSPILGRAADRWGDRAALFGCLAVWVVVVVGTWRLGWTGDGLREFWVIGIVAGFVLGPTQSLARSFLARGASPEAAGGIFSLLAVSNRFAAVLGPLTYGLVAWATKDLHLAALSLGIFFVAGGSILAGVKPDVLEAELGRFGQKPAGNA